MRLGGTCGVLAETDQQLDAYGQRPLRECHWMYGELAPRQMISLEVEFLAKLNWYDGLQ
jgi:hypothetical protein